MSTKMNCLMVVRCIPQSGKHCLTKKFSPSLLPHHPFSDKGYSVAQDGPEFTM